MSIPPSASPSSAERGLEDEIDALIDALDCYASLGFTIDSKSTKDFVDILRTFKDALKNGSEKFDLLYEVGQFLAQQFCYKYNLFVKVQYLQVVKDFLTRVTDPTLLSFLRPDSASKSSARKTDSDCFQRFLLLPTYFDESCEPGYLPNVISETLKAAQKKAKFSLFRPGSNLFKTEVIPRLNQLSGGVTQKVEACHRVADATWSFQQYIQRNIYRGPLPAVYRAGNFTLAESMRKHLSFIGKSQAQIDARFPSDPPRTAGDPRISICIGIKQFLREQYTRELEKFERETRQEMEKIAAKLRPDEGLRKQYEAERKKEEERQNKYKEQGVESAQKKANEEIRELEKQVREAEERAQRRREALAKPQRDLRKEIDAKLEELAEVERAAQRQFATLQAILVAARSHLGVEVEALVALSQKEEEGAGAEDQSETLNGRLLRGESIAGIARELQQQWTRLAY